MAEGSLQAGIVTDRVHGYITAGVQDGALSRNAALMWYTRPVKFGSVTLEWKAVSGLIDWRQRLLYGKSWMTLVVLASACVLQTNGEDERAPMVGKKQTEQGEIVSSDSLPESVGHQAVLLPWQRMIPV